MIYRAFSDPCHDAKRDPGESAAFMMYWPFHRKLKLLLQDSGLNQSDLAGLMNVSRATVCSWLKNRYEPTSRHLRGMAVLFRLKASWFRDEKVPYPPPDAYRLSEEELTLLHGTGNPGKGGDPSEPHLRPVGGDGRSPPALEQLKENLFAVNDPALKKLFAEIEAALREGNPEEMDRLCRRLKGLLKRTAGGAGPASELKRKERKVFGRIAMMGRKNNDHEE